MKYSKYNYVIVGSGISGLYLANKLALNSNLLDGILIVTKEELFSGSSALAQGGIVSVIPELNEKDSIESHIKDTMEAGCGLNNFSTVEYVSKASSAITEELIKFGVEFDKNNNNILNFTLEGAHSCPRILHAQGDSTGRVIEEVLCKQTLNKNNITVYTNEIALELLIGQDGACHGLICANSVNGEYETIYSNNVILATGGIGQVYSKTTNPEASTGDGIALASRAGAELENMEFVQFHPSALYCKDKKTIPLISESVRGEGAKLVDLNGKYFMKDYSLQLDLAPRDVVSRAIKAHCDNNGFDHVNLDISSIGYEKFKDRFPTITKLCMENDIDFSNNLIPVTPAEHYFMGGIKVDLNSRTSIENLYAIGECASTGLHGANRLASNSLLECCVFAQTLSEYLLEKNVLPPNRLDLKVNKMVEKYNDLDKLTCDDDSILSMYLTRIKVTMMDNVGIERNSTALNKQMQILSNIENEFLKQDFANTKLKYEFNNILLVAKLITQAAINNTTSIGSHYRCDLNQNNTLINNKEKLNEILSK